METDISKEVCDVICLSEVEDIDRSTCSKYICCGMLRCRMLRYDM